MSNYTGERWEAVASAWRKAAKQNESVRLNAPEFIQWLKREGYIKDCICVLEEELAEIAHEIDADLINVDYDPTDEELEGIDCGLRDAEQGRFAPDAQVEAVFAKFRRG